MENCGFKKTKFGFDYHGKLEDCILKAKEKVKKLEKDRVYFERRYNEELRKYNSYFNALNNAKEFIRLAERKLNEIENKSNEKESI